MNKMKLKKVGGGVGLVGGMNNMNSSQLNNSGGCLPDKK